MGFAVACRCPVSVAVRLKVEGVNANGMIFDKRLDCPLIRLQRGEERRGDGAVSLKDVAAWSGAEQGRAGQSRGRAFQSRVIFPLTSPAISVGCLDHSAASTARQQQTFCAMQPPGGAGRSVAGQGGAVRVNEVSPRTAAGPLRDEFRTLL